MLGQSVVKDFWKWKWNWENWLLYGFIDWKGNELRRPEIGSLSKSCKSGQCNLKWGIF